MIANLFTSTRVTIALLAALGALFVLALLSGPKAPEEVARQRAGQYLLYAPGTK